MDHTQQVIDTTTELGVKRVAFSIFTRNIKGPKRHKEENIVKYINGKMFIEKNLLSKCKSNSYGL